jgi:nucleotide-binding universal stress UspA family protein
LYKRVLVPLDGSELAECVLSHVNLISQGYQAKEVIFLSVIELPKDVSYAKVLFENEVIRIKSEMKANAEEYLRQLLGRISYAGVDVRWEVITGPVVESINDYATKHEVDLIIVATHGRSGISRWLLGSMAERILRSSSIPVLMIRAPGCISGL